ncbi:MAG: SCP2 sterol-binding domain-containing protein [Actinomycetota bacterium]|nr:SCP2 sterol-binding domain-containing protein [Actinomycetota bacterium]
MFPTTVLAQARSALEATARKTADLIRSVPELSPAIPESEWTVREAAVHLVNLAGIYTDIADGMPSPIESMTREALAKQNARRLGDIPESDPEKVAGLLTEAVAGLLESTACRSGDQEVVFHAGVSLDLASLMCFSLGEHILHGYDIARAVGSPWPIDPLHARLVLSGYGPCYDAWLNGEAASGLTTSYRIELRGGDDFTMRLSAGACHVEAGDTGAVDCTIDADPVAYLLVRSGRMTQWEAIALGLYSVDGPVPELGLRFMDLFAYP